MAHKIDWFIEKRVLLLVYEGDVDSSEMKTVNEELKALLMAGQKPVHLISDDTKVAKLNTNLNQLVNTFTVLRLPDWGYIIAIGTSIRTRFFYNTLKVLLNMDLMLCATREKAYAQLIKLDASLSEGAKTN
jgi:hypothetical protein